MKNFLLIVFICMIELEIILSDEYTVDDSNGTGRRFDGVGGISGGGATSKLLMNYPEKERNEVLDYLFKPNFGASLHLLKVEIGGDAQSTEGTEASHMHNEWEENYNRGYEWWIMKEAKKRNPNILLYALPWGFPGWVGKGTSDPYIDISRPAEYVTKWITGAKMYHNLTIDYVGIWNEKPYNTKYIKLLRNTLDSKGFKNVRIVAADGKWFIAEDVLKDEELANAVDYLGCHYPGTYSDDQAKATKKQLWSSEDYSTINDMVGGGCMARILNQNYVNGLMTGTIIWNLIASYYSKLPYPDCGIMTANCPWCGHYDVRSPVWSVAHTTQFTEPGWKYLSHNQGVTALKSGGSMVSLLSPDKTHLTIIIETMSHDKSVCIRPPLPPFKVANQTIRLTLKGSFSKLASLNVWYSKLEKTESKSILFMKKDSIKVINGTFVLTLGVDEIYTLTSLTTGLKGTYPAPPPNKPFPLQYTENFETYSINMEPFEMAQQMGAFEVLKDNSSKNKFLRQMVLKRPVYWCEADTINQTLNVFGNYLWRNVNFTADIAVPEINGTESIYIAARIEKGGCGAFFTSGIFLYINFKLKSYTLSSSNSHITVLDKGNAPVRKGWNTISLLLDEKKIQGKLNNVTLFTKEEESGPNNGFVGIGTDTFGLADFDNLIISAQDLNASNDKYVLPDKSLYFKSLQTNTKKSQYLYKNKHVVPFV